MVVETWRGPSRKRAAGGGEQKEAAGGYRSRGLEGVLAERELRGGGGAEGSSRRL